MSQEAKCFNTPYLYTTNSQYKNKNKWSPV